MGLVSIGEFSRLSRLSPKALRLYDELGLLVPDHVDMATGYRWYADTQLDQARVVALLRRIGVPLAQIEMMQIGREFFIHRMARRLVLPAYWRAGCRS